MFRTSNSPRSSSHKSLSGHGSLRGDMIPEESDSEYGLDNLSDDRGSEEPRDRLSDSVKSPKKSSEKKKSKKKKLKKGIKKVMKLAATPVVATSHVVSKTGTMAMESVSQVGSDMGSMMFGHQSHRTSEQDNDQQYDDKNNNKKDKNKKDKKKKKQKEDYVIDSGDDDDELFDEIEQSSEIVSMVKYEKVKSQLADKNHLVDTLLSKIKLLEETIAEKDEIIMKLQNLDILANAIQEKDEILKKLMANEKVDQNELTNYATSKSSEDVLTEMRTYNKSAAAMNNAGYYKSFRRISSQSENDLLENIEKLNKDDTFVAWKRQDRKYKKSDSFEGNKGVVPIGFSRATSAEIERTKRQETSDVLHKLRKANKKKTTTSPKQHKKNKDKKDEPWNALHNFMLPVFDKTEAERDTIRKAFESNYIFENLSLASVDTFIQAFENVQVKKGYVIQREGEKVDYFYIVADGEVSIEAYGSVRKAGPGTGIGAMSLLHTTTPKTTVTAETEPTKLFRVDQKTFRFKMKKEVKDTNRKKIDLLKAIPYLKDFEAADLQRLCDNMIDRKFEKGEEVISKDKSTDTFYVVMSGCMAVTTGEDGYDEQVLEKGGYFGETALTKKSSSSTSTASLVGHETGWCFGIDAVTFEKVMGSYTRLTTKSKDKAVLKKIRLFKDSKLEESLVNSLTEAVVTRFFEKGSIIQEIDEITDAALYIVREGSVVIGENRVIQAGNSFGTDQLAADAKGLADPKAKIIAKFTARANEDVRCGVLTLAECRLLMDTKNDFKVPGGGGDAMGGRKRDHRAIMKRRSIGMSMGVFGSSNKMGDELPEDFANERAAVHEFYKSFKTPIEELPREKVLGEGQFGQVWLVKLQDGELKEDFALKIQDLGDAYESESLENIYREIAVIKDLQHPFIVALIDSKETDTESLMLMTLCTGGELWSVVHWKDDDGKWHAGVKEEGIAKFYSLIIADTLAYMHRKNVLYRDLKPENVLLDATGYPNIIDFGFAKKTTEKTYTLCGTPNYMSPEIILISGHHVGADHWALGIMIYEMISGEHPFYYEGLNNAELFDLVTNTEAFPCEKASKEAQAILNGLLEKDPTQRLGVLAGKERDILRHDWYKGLDLGKLRKREIKAPYIPPPP